MATLNIASATIRATGWDMDVVVEATTIGGTYAFGMGTNNDPTGAYVVLTVTSQGYNNEGTLGTIVRTVYGVPTTYPVGMGAVRKVYPNNASPDETTVGSDISIRVALSEFIYNDDTSITVDFSAGWYTKGADSTGAENDLAVTNNSALDYPRVIGNWSIPNHETIIGTSLKLECCCFHHFAMSGSQVACVIFTATDGTHSVSGTATAMTVFTDSPLHAIVGYEATLDLTTLDDNSFVTLSFIAYPWVGDADSILNTGDAVNTPPTPLYANLSYRLDKGGDHGYIVVDPVGGSDTTGTVYASQSLAEAGSANLTIASALTKLQTYHNTNSGHNTAGGGFILHKGTGTISLASTNGGTLTQWVTIMPATGVSKENAVVQSTGAASSMPTRLKVKGCTFSGTGYWNAAGTKSIMFDDCNLTATGTVTIYDILYGVLRNCTGAVVNLAGYSTTRANWGLLRGNNLTGYHKSIAFNIIGNNNISVEGRASTGNNTPFNDNLIFAYNLVGSSSVATQVKLGATTENIVHGAAIVQNLIIRYGAQTESLLMVFCDSSTASSNNILMHHNITPGGRENSGYNDLPTGTGGLHTNWSVKNNIWQMYANKDDTYANNANNIGSWAVGYRVGHSGNFSMDMNGVEWNGEFHGLYSILNSDWTPAGFITDNSSDGANTSGGNYHLTQASPCLTLAHDFILKYDFKGELRAADAASGVYIDSPYAAILRRYNGSTWVKEPLKVYTGGSFQAKPLKVRLGAAWYTVDTTGI